jgi:hypothetical protein
MNNKRFCNAAFWMLILVVLILICATGFAQGRGSGDYNGEYMTATHSFEGRTMRLIRISGSTWKGYVRYDFQGDKNWSPYGSGTLTVKDNVITMIDPEIGPDHPMDPGTYIYEWNRTPSYASNNVVITLTDERGIIYIKQ